MTSPDVGKLRELAESALVDDERQISHEGGKLLARGLLSALDALEAANGERDEALAALFKIVVAAGEDTDGTDRFHCSFEQALAWAVRAVEDLRADYDANDALAGVPGGSPEEEEHNPGGTAVAVPGSEIEGRTDVQH